MTVVLEVGMGNPARVTNHHPGQMVFTAPLKVSQSAFLGVSQKQNAIKAPRCLARLKCRGRQSSTREETTSHLGGAFLAAAILFDKSFSYLQKVFCRAAPVTRF